MRVGFSPITFNNEDLPDRAPAVPYEEVLDTIARLGYAGTERGAHFPTDPRVLAGALAARGLVLVSGWCSLDLLDLDVADRRRATLETIARYLRASGARMINLAVAATPERRLAAGRVEAGEGPRLDADAWGTLARRVEEAARLCRDLGLTVAFHPHAGTWVETASEVQTLCRLTDPDLVGLCLDVGHALYGGIDPIRMLEEQAARIRYIHVKDVDPAVLSSLRARREGFDEGLRRYVFTELGRGALDLPALAATLRQIGYDGWLMVEQDTSRLPPARVARESRGALSDVGLWPEGG